MVYNPYTSYAGASVAPITPVPQPQPQPQPTANKIEVLCVTSDADVENYVVIPGQHGMFMNMNEMKVYTKDGTNGLIRDFNLIETEESLKRYQQQKQIENAQFPVVDATAREVGENGLKEVEERMNEKFDILEKSIAELAQSIRSNNNNNRNNNRGNKP